MTLVHLPISGADVKHGTLRVQAPHAAGTGWLDAKYEDDSYVIVGNTGDLNYLDVRLTGIRYYTGDDAS
jgi:hypothetical protein